MKKKILVILLSLVAFCLCTAAPVLAVQDGFSNEYARVRDSAELLTESEESTLAAKLDEIRIRQKVDIVVVTTTTLNGQTPRDYADDYFDYNGFGYGENRDGVLLLISTEESDWYISTHGYAITVFTDAGIEYIGGQMRGDLSDGDFAGAFDTFARLSECSIKGIFKMISGKHRNACLRKRLKKTRTSCPKTNNTNRVFIGC